MLIRKHFAIGVYLLLIGLFATPPPSLRADDECRRPLPSFSVRYTALFYEIVARLLTDALSHQTFINTSVIFGDLLLKELDNRVVRVRGMTKNADEANKWEHLMLQYNVLQFVYFLANQALEYHEAYATIRAENDLQTQLADQQLAQENILEVMHNIQNYFILPTVHNKILKYELLKTPQLPLVAIILNASDQQPKLFLDLKYSCSKFLYEPEVEEQPHVVGYFRTFLEGRPDLNVLNDYTILLRALREVKSELDALANRSQYSDYFLAIVPPSTLVRAQKFIRKLSADSPLTFVVEYQLIVTTFLHFLLNFIYGEYDWQYCHPVRRQLTPLLNETWEQINIAANKTFKSYESAHNLYVKLPNLQDKMNALYKSLNEYNIRVGFTLRPDISAAFGDHTVQRRRKKAIFEIP